LVAGLASDLQKKQKATYFKGSLLEQGPRRNQLNQFDLESGYEMEAGGGGL